MAGSIENEQKLVAFDTAGNEIARSSEKLFGNGISAMTETENGYMTASVSHYHLIKNDGTLLEKRFNKITVRCRRGCLAEKNSFLWNICPVLALCGAKEQMTLPRHYYTESRDFDAEVKQYEENSAILALFALLVEYYCFAEPDVLKSSDGDYEYTAAGVITSYYGGENARCTC